MTEFETRLGKFREGYRENLIKSFREVARLESLTELEDLKLKSCNEGNGILALYYEAVSKEYPNINKLLMQSGVAKKHNIQYGRRILPNYLLDHTFNDIQGRLYREHCQYESQLSYHGGKLQIFLKVWPKLKEKKK